jgi:serine protease AprX
MTTCIGVGNGFLSNHRYLGVAPQANLVLVKTGNRRSRRITERDIHRALNWVLANYRRFDIRVVNISLGGDIPSTGQLTRLDRKVEELASHGMVVVAAAGNSGDQRIIPPASAPSAITVGGMDDQNSLDRRYRRMYRSSYGTGVRGVRKPELIAPAMWLAAPMLPGTVVHNEAQFLWRMLNASDAEIRRILDTDYAQARISKATQSLPIAEIRNVIRRRMIEQKYIHRHYQHVDGTSMAAPIVSAVVAQMLEANPALTPEQARHHLLGTADPLPNVPTERQGAGAVNGGRAVASALHALYHDRTATLVMRRRSLMFHLFDPDARQVTLIGGFNGWQPDRGEMEQVSQGVWQIAIAKPPRGTYPYKFLIDGARWMADPENVERIEDGYGGFNSLLTVER